MPPRKRTKREEQEQPVGEGPSTSRAAGANDGHVYRMAFLQAMMQRQYCSEQQAKELYRKTTSAASDARYLDFLAAINQHLSFAQFELRRVKYPGDGTHYLGFVNNEADEESKRALKYRTRDGKPELRVTAFFRMLLEKIATSEDTVAGGLGYIRSGEALRAPVEATQATQAPATQGEAGPSGTQAVPVGNLSMKDRQQVLNQLVFDGWLAHTPNLEGAYSLGPRSYLELGSYMLELDLPEDTRRALQSML